MYRNKLLDVITNQQVKNSWNELDLQLQGFPMVGKTYLTKVCSEQSTL